ncbi:MAG: hypothetical protein QF368_10230, partial [SAR202 cluster bacterium]|nr:hypothetical protein [SAR202 cluster bacterium]
QRIVEAITGTSDRWAMIASPQGRESELYHLQADPEQRNNLSGNEQETESDMRSAIVDFLQEHGATDERVRPFQDGIAELDMDQGTDLWAFKDDRGRWIAFPSQEQAVEMATSPEGDEALEVTKTTLGNLLDDDPHSLIQTHGQYYWAEDLL